MLGGMSLNLLTHTSVPVAPWHLVQMAHEAERRECVVCWPRGGNMSGPGDLSLKDLLAHLQRTLWF